MLSIKIEHQPWIGSLDLQQMILEYLWAIPKHPEPDQEILEPILGTRLADRYAACHDDPEHLERQQIYRAIFILHAYRHTYAKGFPPIMIGLGKLDCKQVILPKILERHCQIRRAKSARSAEC